MKPIVLVDVDGTLALRGDRAPHDHDSAMEDAVNWPIVRLCDALFRSGVYDIYVMSGRDEKYRDVTEYWFDRHLILHYRQELIMRKRGDSRPDEVVKKELYQEHEHLSRRVWAILDDRNKVVKMWRDLGLTCLQVADGSF
jgi:hypothetical protein